MQQVTQTLTCAAPTTGTVAVPPEFFRGELRVYGDWRTAFARELLQNATDATPSRIDVTFDDSGPRGRVVFTDDGVGMSRAVLENVFFALGRTTKNDAGSIGGFGRARIIICFAQTRYEIRTGNLLVVGQGGEYTITEVAEHQRGCRFTIDLLDADTRMVRDAFERLLRTCSLDVPVYLDGERAAGHRTSARANRVLRDGDGQPWGRVYASPGWGRVLVRVRGLTMFVRSSGGDDNVVLELEPRRSREVLSASRDTLHTGFGQQLDQFVADLTQNRRRALRPASQPLNVHVAAGGFLATDAHTTPASASGTTPEPAVGLEPVLDLPAGAAPRPAGSPGEGSGGTWVPVTPANAAAYEHLAHPTGPVPAGAALRPAAAVDLGFDVFLLADSSDARVRKLARAWNPASWDERAGARRRALLLTWKAAVGYCLDVLVQMRPDVGRVLWTVGWTFDEQTQALCRSGGDGHVFALNPVTDTGARRYSVSSRTSRNQLLAVAAHEVCHVVASDHDERFAGLLTDLFGAIDTAAADKVLREAR